MAAGLEVYDANGNLMTGITDSIPAIAGYFITSANSGSLPVPQLIGRETFAIIYYTSFPVIPVTNSADVYIYNGVLYWQKSANSGNATILYGVIG